MGGVENEELALQERLLKSLQRVVGAAEASSNPGFQLKISLAIPHRQRSVKKYPKNHLPKCQLASMHSKVDDYQMEMQGFINPLSCSIWSKKLQELRKNSIKYEDCFYLLCLQNIKSN